MSFQNCVNLSRMEAFIAWLQEVEEAKISISAVTIGELQAGVELTRRKDEDKAAEIEAWVDKIADAYQIIAMDAGAFREWAKLYGWQT